MTTNQFNVINVGENITWNKITYDMQNYVMCGSLGSVSITSDLVNWEIIKVGSDSKNWLSIDVYVHLPTRIYVMCSDEGDVAYSTDAHEWEINPIHDKRLNFIKWVGLICYVCGDGIIAYSYDMKYWESSLHPGCDYNYMYVYWNMTYIFSYNSNVFNINPRLINTPYWCDLYRTNLDVENTECVCAIADLRAFPIFSVSVFGKHGSITSVYAAESERDEIKLIPGDEVVSACTYHNFVYVLTQDGCIYRYQYPSANSCKYNIQCEKIHDGPIKWRSIYKDQQHTIICGHEHVAII